MLTPIQACSDKCLIFFSTRGYFYSEFCSTTSNSSVPGYSCSGPGWVRSGDWASPRNHLLVKTLFPCELLPFCKLFMENSSELSSNIWDDFPFFSSQREHCQRFLVHVTIRPVNVICLENLLIHWTNEFVHVNFEPK